MNILNNLNKDLTSVLNKFNLSENIDLKISNIEEFDFQINNLVKHQQHIDINEIKKQFEEKLSNCDEIFNYEITKSLFINIELNLDLILNEFENLNEIIKIDKKQKIIIDYGGPNIGKPLHVGHLRSLNIGRSLYSINKAAGNQIVSDIHLGDWGMPIAQILTFCEENDIQIDKLTINKLVEIYPKASSQYQNKKDFEEKAKKINLDLNNSDKETLKKWAMIKKLSIDSIKTTLDKLNHGFDFWLGESDVNHLIPEMLKNLEDTNKISKDNGAFVSNLDCDPKILITKSDGSYLYLTTDLATVLHRLKNNEFDKILYVVDNRQTLHFKQLFDSINYFSFSNKNFEHISFGTVNDENGNPLKTRDGGTKQLNELFLETYNYIKKMNDSLDEENLEILANTVITYSDLLTNRKTDYKFDLKKFTNVNGKTGIYIQYALVRAKKLFLDSKVVKKDLKLNSLLLDTEDIDFLKCLIKFEIHFNQALTNSEPHHLADYLYDISNLFNKIYQSENILNNENNEKKLNKLLICYYFIEYSNLLMKLLGIRSVSKM
tara:strand:+ start:6262 stop:7905 length:1644 start_codon:yes stop_codon:yes gene_type:complete